MADQGRTRLPITRRTRRIRMLRVHSTAAPRTRSTRMLLMLSMTTDINTRAASICRS